MHVYVSVGGIRMCAYMLACVCACEDQKVTLGVFFCCSSTWFLRQTLSLTDQKAPEICQFPHLSPGVVRACCHSQLSWRYCLSKLSSSRLCKKLFYHETFFSSILEWSCLIIPLLPLFLPPSTLLFFFQQQFVQYPIWYKYYG